MAEPDQPASEKLADQVLPCLPKMDYILLMQDRG